MQAVRVSRKEEAGRTQKSARNFLFTLCANGVAILIGLVAQRIFVRILGLEYAGLNGLFSNVITMLAIADLGIGEAIVFHLYKPLEKKDIEKRNNTASIQESEWSLGQHEDHGKRHG